MKISFMDYFILPWLLFFQAPQPLSRNFAPNTELPLHLHH